eukprot:c18754_g1_i2 orf=130-732(-)
MLGKTTTKHVYSELIYSRWERKDLEWWWTKRCFKVWKGTPFAKINLWNWRVMSGSLMTGNKLRFWGNVSGLCPWCKRDKETLIHLFWACPVTKHFWKNFSLILKAVFGEAKPAAHMVLLGNVREHSSNFCFTWQLNRAVAIETLWRIRNQSIFQKGSVEIQEQQASICVYKAAKLLQIWPGKGKEIASQIAVRMLEIVQN